MNLSNIARGVLTDSTALLSALLIGVIGLAFYHVPLAITPWQVVVIELLVLAYPVAVLKHDKPGRKHGQPRPQIIFEIITFGILAAIISYLNYRLFFARHDLSPAYIDTIHPLYAQATTLCCLTIALCQLMNAYFLQADTRKHVMDNQKFVQAAGLSLFALLNIIYNPWLHGLFGTRALDSIDLLMALVGAGVYVGLRRLQRHTRQHTRHAVIKLHHEVHGKR